MLNQAFAGPCVSLGSTQATVQLASHRRHRGERYVGGRPAAVIKELICKGTVSFIRARAASPARSSGSRAASDPPRTRSRPDGAEHADRFTHLRPLLFTIVYEILGSATESDDVLQDSYLRWAEVDLATVRDTKSYLAQLVTRQALNALRAGARRREEYIGPWLPEPLLLDERDASADVVLAESVSMAMLVLLETLTPTSGRCSCCARCSASTTTKSQARWANP